MNLQPSAALQKQLENYTPGFSAENAIYREAKEKYNIYVNFADFKAPLT